MERDKFLLSKLQSYALLTTRQVAGMVFPGVAITTVLRRLRALEADGYVQRIEGLPSTERAWGVTKRAAAMYPEKASKVHFPRHSLDHDLTLTELRLLLEGKGTAHSWIPEHEVRAKIARAHGIRQASRMVVPDGIVGIENNGLKDSIALELELNFKNSRRYRSIFQDYERKKSLYAVWYVVATKAMGRHLVKCQGEYHFRSRPFLFWSLLEDVMSSTDAKLWCRDKEYLVSQIFTKKFPEPAQKPALEVSGLGQKLNSEIPELTHENNSEKIAPVS